MDVINVVIGRSTTKRDALMTKHDAFYTLRVIIE